MTADAAAAGLSTTEPPTGPIDHAVLEQLRVDLDDEDGSAVADLVSIYVDSSEALIPELTAALRSGDTSTADRCAHALASPTSLVGARPLGALLLRVRDCAHVSTQPADLAALADGIWSESHRVAAGLVEFARTGRTVADT